MNSRLCLCSLRYIAVLALLAGAIQLLGQAPQLLPYQTTLLAGGGSASATYAANAICPSSGNTMTDQYGDGCLATEVVLNTPRYVTADTNGNIYFSDTGNKLVRKISASTGIITRVAGGGSLALPTTSGTTCGSLAATDFQGDGCLATDVTLSKPSGVAISPLTGDLYFADFGNYTVRRIDHTTGVVYNVAGYIAGSTATYGYIANTASTTITAASASALDAPYGIHFDATGNLYIAEQYKEALLVVNTTSSTTTVAGISIAAGSIAKIAGYNSPANGAYCPNGTTSSSGCKFGTWTNGVSASTSGLDYPYDVTTDSAGNVYFANEYNPAVGKVSSAGLISTYAGTQAVISTTSLDTNKRAVSTAVQFGSTYGIASDANGNIYIPDSVTGWIWRVDAGTQAMWVFAGGASTVCSGGDSYGDGCPASQTIFPTGTQKTTSGLVVSASTPGISGMFVDASGSLLIVNYAKNLLHKISTNTNFGTILPTNPTQTLEVHFPAGDALGSVALTTNTSNFTLDTTSCTQNSDNTVDCLLPVTATPQQAGAFASILQVTSANGKTSSFTLSGTLELNQKPSMTTVSLSSNTTNSATSVTLTATVTNSYSSPNTGTVEFYANNGTTTTDLGSATLTNGTASITQSFATGSYTIYAAYSGNLYLNASTSQSVALNSVIPTFTMATTTSQSSVGQGQTALYSFTVTSVGSYKGTVTFACSGLPANTSCVFSPTSLTVGTDSYNTETLNIVTTSSQTASLDRNETGNHSTLWALLLPGGAVLLFGLRRRKYAAFFSLLALALLSAAALTGCNSSTVNSTATSAGSYTVTVTATGTPNVVSTSANVVQTISIPLTVSKY